MQNKSIFPSFSATLIWMNERTPVPILLWAALLYLFASKLSQHINNISTAVTNADFLGIVAVISYFVMMRTIDEHKDFKDDNANYPKRPVQRGLISLEQLKTIAILCLAMQLIISIYIDQGFGYSVIYWLITTLWLGLMTKEFFIANWLRDRIVIYAISHMFIMCLMALWLMQLGSAENFINPVQVWPVMLMFFLSGFMAEIIRKTRSPDEERENVDSYSKIFGPQGATLIVVILLWTTLPINLHYIENLSTSHYAKLIKITYLLATLIMLPFIIRPYKKGRKVNEAAVGLSLLISFSTMTLALINHV